MGKMIVVIGVPYFYNNVRSLRNHFHYQTTSTMVLDTQVCPSSFQQNCNFCKHKMTSTFWNWRVATLLFIATCETARHFPLQPQRQNRSARSTALYIRSPLITRLLEKTFRFQVSRTIESLKAKGQGHGRAISASDLMQKGVGRVRGTLVDPIPRKMYVSKDDQRGEK